MADVYVVNASPIILLGKIERLDILACVGTKLLVPSAVVQEIEVGADGLPMTTWPHGSVQRHSAVP